jgi:hypothetical protein
MRTLGRNSGTQKLIFLQRRNDTYYLHSEVNIDKDAEAYEKSGKRYRINRNLAMYDSGPIVYDVDNCEPIVFETLTAKKSPVDLSNYMKSSALGRLIQGHLLKILLIVVGLMAVGIIITGAWGTYSVGVANKQLADITLKYMNATTGGLIH